MIAKTLWILLWVITPAWTVPVVFGSNKPVEPKAAEFPFQASLMQMINPKRKIYHSFCGGTLIHKEWILTAAHCLLLDEASSPIQASSIYVALGSIYRDARGAQIIRGKVATIHPSYIKTRVRHDIGLVKLSSAAKLDANVKLVKLHLSAKENLIGNTAFLTGFGIINDHDKSPERLRKATLKISKNSRCYNNDGRYAERELCGTSKIKDGKACRGDSGGPLTILRGGKLLQVGVTSRLSASAVCMDGFNHSIYTRVSSYISWISKATGINFTK